MPENNKIGLLREFNRHFDADVHFAGMFRRASENVPEQHSITRRNSPSFPMAFYDAVSLKKCECECPVKYRNSQALCVASN